MTIINGSHVNITNSGNIHLYILSNFNNECPKLRGINIYDSKELNIHSLNRRNNGTGNQSRLAFYNLTTVNIVRVNRININNIFFWAPKSLMYISDFNRLIMSDLSILGGSTYSSNLLSIFRGKFVKIDKFEYGENFNSLVISNVSNVNVKNSIIFDNKGNASTGMNIINV